MRLHTGTYSVKGGTAYTATFSFLKDKLSIQFTDEGRTKREVFWYYDEINKQDLKQGPGSVIRYSGYPEQRIEIFSPEFNRLLGDLIERQDKKFFLKAIGHSLPLLRVLGIVILLLSAAYLWLVPYLAGRLAEKVPVTYEQNLGDALYDRMKGGFVIDEKKTVYINEFFRELNIVTPYTIHITVVKADLANAFAIPGGNIIVYDEIVDGMQDYTELGALLAHEFCHIQNRHTTRSLFRQMGQSAFLSVFLGNTNAISHRIIRNADRLKSLSYGRSLEKEADLEGLKILNDHKIDGNGFLKLFEQLKKRDNPSLSEWTSSHPDLDRRIEYVKSNLLLNKQAVQQNETLQVLFNKIHAAE